MENIAQLPTIEVAENFLVTAANLSVKELEVLSKELNALIRRKKTVDKTYREKVLLGKINQTALAKTELERYIILVEKLELETIQEIEYQEFMQLVAKDEKLRNERVKYLIELSQLRGISLLQLMEDMGLNPTAHG
jgi:hypothetical protein